MQFTITRPNGTTERRQHIAYTVRQTAPGEWCAYRTDGSLLGRSRINESHLRSVCDTCTEPAR